MQYLVVVHGLYHYSLMHALYQDNIDQGQFNSVWQVHGSLGQARFNWLRHISAVVVVGVVQC